MEPRYASLAAIMGTLGCLALVAGVVLVHCKLDGNVEPCQHAKDVHSVGLVMSGIESQPVAACPRSDAIDQINRRFHTPVEAATSDIERVGGVMLHHFDGCRHAHGLDPGTSAIAPPVCPCRRCALTQRPIGRDPSAQTRTPPAGGCHARPIVSRHTRFHRWQTQASHSGTGSWSCAGGADDANYVAIAYLRSTFTTGSTVPTAPTASVSQSFQVSQVSCSNRA